MDLKHISAELSVSPQVAPSDMGTVAAEGFRSVICNRPDAEGPDQPSFAEVEAAAKDAGLETRYLPIVSGTVRDEDAQDFAAAMKELPGPVLAYCRSGTRSATLWSLSQAQKRPVSEILAMTKAAGYDMNGLVGRMAEVAKRQTPSAV